MGGPGTTCGHFFRDLCKNGRSVKTNNTPTLLVVFGDWGLLWRVLEAVLGAFWGLCWKMLAPRWCFFGYLGRCCGILAPRWRTRAPRRGKIGELRRQEPLQGGGALRGAVTYPPAPPKKNPPGWGCKLQPPDSSSQLQLDWNMKAEAWSLEA